MKCDKFVMRSARIIAQWQTANDSRPSTECMDKRSCDGQTTDRRTEAHGGKRHVSPSWWWWSVNRTLHWTGIYSTRTYLLHYW